MRFLSICFANHDANLSFFDGNTLHYAKTERITGIKRHWYDNLWSWKYDVKRLWNVDANDVDHIVLQIENGMMDKIQHLISEDTKEDFNDLYSGNKNYIKLRQEFGTLLGIDHSKLIAISHYYAHALSVHTMTDKTPDVYMVIDCYGDGDRSWSVYRDDKLVDKGIFCDNSLGEEINNMGRRLKVQAHHDVEIAGKVMGLQSYGRIDSGYLDQSKQYNMWQVRDLYSFDRYTQYKGDPLVAEYTALNWARTVHHQTEYMLVEFFKEYANPDETIFYSGGVAQNVVWNTKLRKHFPNIFIPPHSSDEGISLGGIELLRRLHDLPPIRLKDFPYCQSDEWIGAANNDTIKNAARLLADGKTIGWYQCHGEVGPRALGNRSILMDPRIANGKAHINRIKRRENYRPFGASVLKEHIHEYFYSDGEDPYMLFTSMVKDDTLQSITHVDGTCRVQTVDDTNPTFRALLEEFYKLTGCPILLNTSLNLAGQALAGYPEAALQIFTDTELDCLFVGNQYYYKG